MVRYLPALLAAATLFAHHSISAEYDVTKPTDYQGTVEGAPKMVNPHATYTLRVEKQDGRSEAWTFELGSAAALAQAGWTRETLKAGDAVTVTAVPAKDGSPRSATIRIRWADGRVVENQDRWWKMSAEGVPTPNIAPRVK